jgi:hypothetical protein
VAAFFFVATFVFVVVGATFNGGHGGGRMVQPSMLPAARAAAGESERSRPDGAGSIRFLSISFLSGSHSFRGGGEMPSREGMERGFFSMEKKREGDRKTAGDDFISYMTTFLVLGRG